MATSVMSDMNLCALQDYVREHSQKIHPKSTDTIFRIGMIGFVNPRIQTPNDFANEAPYFLGL